MGEYFRCLSTDNRIMPSAQVALANEATELERTKRDEQLAHDKSHDFLAKKLEDLTAQRVEWAEKYYFKCRNIILDHTYLVCISKSMCT